MQLKLNPLKTATAIGFTSKINPVEVFMGKLDSADTDIMLSMIQTFRDTNSQFVYMNEADKEYLKTIIMKFSDIMSYVIGAKIPEYEVKEEELDELVNKVMTMKREHGFINTLLPLGCNSISGFLSKARASVREAELEFGKVYYEDVKTRLNKIDPIAYRAEVFDTDAFDNAKYLDDVLKDLSTKGLWKQNQYDVIYEYINKVSLYLYYLAAKYEKLSYL